MEIRKVFSWTAVFVGALTGFGLNFLLNLFSLSIGLSIFSSQTNDKISFSIMGAMIFLLFSIFVMFTTGWIAGRLSVINNVRKIWGVLYGFVAWCLCFIMTVLLLMNVIQFTQFHSNFTSKNLTSIRITNQLPMMTESQSSNSESDKRVISINAFVTFALFLTGAISSSLGGYVGFNPKIKEQTKL